MNTDQLNLLKVCVMESDPQLMKILSSNKLDNTMIDKNRKRLIDAVIDKLLRYGFDEEWKPTELGVQLEDLINILLKTDLR